MDNQICAPFYSGDHYVWFEPMASAWSHYVVHACSHVYRVGYALIEALRIIGESGIVWAQVINHQSSLSLLHISMCHLGVITEQNRNNTFVEFTGITGLVGTIMGGVLDECRSKHPLRTRDCS